MIILDGIGDRPIKEINNKTPLEYSDTPNLDKIAKNGINGIMDPLGPGKRPGSDTSHLSLLGYDAEETYTGRGPFEAAGAGIEVKKGDIAFRVNYATKKENKIIDRRANRINETKQIAESIQEINKIEDTEIFFKDSTSHRAALVLRGNGLSDKVTSTDPKKPNREPKEIKALSKEAEKTAKILRKYMEKVEEKLQNHPVNKKRIKNNKLPANTILLRGAGKTPEIKDFKEKHGINGAIITATGLIKGIGKITNMEVYQPKNTTGGFDSNLKNKAKKTLEAIKRHDFVLLHIKGTDEVSHDGDVTKKITFLEQKIDPAIEKILKNIGKENLIVLTGDHSTPINLKDHSADPVPVSIMGEQTRKDEIENFNENTYKGGLTRIRGKDLFPICLDLIDKTDKFGA